MNPSLVILCYAILLALAVLRLRWAWKRGYYSPPPLREIRKWLRLLRSKN